MNPADSWFPQPVVLHTCPRCLFSRPVHYSPSVYSQNISCERCAHTTYTSGADLEAVQSNADDAQLSELFARHVAVSPTQSATPATPSQQPSSALTGPAAAASLSSSPASSTDSTAFSPHSQQHQSGIPFAGGLRSTTAPASPQPAHEQQQQQHGQQQHVPDPAAHRSHASSHYTHSAHFLTSASATAAMAGGGGGFLGSGGYLGGGYLGSSGYLWGGAARAKTQQTPPTTDAGSVDVEMG